MLSWEDSNGIESGRPQTSRRDRKVCDPLLRYHPTAAWTPKQLLPVADCYGEHALIIRMRVLTHQMLMPTRINAATSAIRRSWPQLNIARDRLAQKGVPVHASLSRRLICVHWRRLFQRMSATTRGGLNSRDRLATAGLDLFLDLGAQFMQPFGHPSVRLHAPAGLRQDRALRNDFGNAGLDERLRALDFIRKRETNAAWKLMRGALPQGDDSSNPSPMPRWRDFTVDKVEVVTWGLIGRGAAAISERLVADVGLSPARWSLLLDRIGDLAPDPEAALLALEAAEPRITDKADRAVFWDKLRRVLHHHREFPDAEWPLADVVLDRLEVVYDRFAPADRLRSSSHRQGARYPRRQLRIGGLSAR
jgi:hypothetical protein